MDTGDTAWMLTSASLVLLMMPGIALFYGGMTRAKSVLNMMMMSFGATGVVGVLFILYGFSMTFSGRDLYGLVASPFTWFGLTGVAGPHGYSFLGSTDGAYVFVAFQITFAIVTVALISGAIADRARFGTWLAFAGLWATFAYFPMAHMVWGAGLLSGASDGIAARLFGTTDGVATVAPIDFAGGTVVHINAGVAAFVLALLLGVRRGFGKEPMRPHNIPFTMLGAGLLWFGWFGFNAGSGLAADRTAGLVWVNTTAATVAAMLGWLLVERVRDGKATSLGAASGVVAGLVSITPGCAAVSPVGALVLGAVTGGLCATAVGLKYRFGYDDSLDVVGVHLVGGLVGTVGVGFLATRTGLFYGHDVRQLIIQMVIAAAAMLLSGAVAVAVGLLLKVTLGWRIAEEREIGGIDLHEHGETAYDLHVSIVGRTSALVGRTDRTGASGTPWPSAAAEVTAEPGRTAKEREVQR